VNARTPYAYLAAGQDQMTADDEAPRLPWSAEAEQSVLGGLLQDNRALPVVAEIISAASFYDHVHRLVFGAIETMLSDNKPADTITVFERLASQHTEPQTGEPVVSLAYLHALSLSVPNASNARRYAEIVADKASERDLIRCLDEASVIGRDSGSPIADRLERITAALQHVEQHRKAPNSRRVPLLPLEGLRQAAEGVEWLVKRVIPSDSVGMLFGGSGTFKTYVALDLALHICHGLPWMGRKTKQGAVIYIAAEGGSGLWARIQAWHLARRLDWKKAPLHVVPVAVDLTTDAWRVVDAAQMAGITPALVVVDTLSQTYSGEENSANEMAAYLRTLGTRFRALWRCSVALLHHSGHAATERPRGSSAIRANIDFLLGLHRDENEMLATLSCIKQKDGEQFSDATFQMTQIVLGEDSDGDPLSQLAARHLSSAQEVSDAMQSEGKAGRGGNNRLILSLIQSHNGQIESALRKSFYEDCGADTADSRRQAYHRAKAWAIKAGFLEVAEGIVIATKAGF
jgi:hypothetical protein